MIVDQKRTPCSFPHLSKVGAGARRRAADSRLLYHQTKRLPPGYPVKSAFDIASQQLLNQIVLESEVS